jgi:ribonuclease III
MAVSTAPLEARLGHTWQQRKELLTQALTHRSFGARNNERLEFLGDGVLNCVIGLMLYQRFPDQPEGRLSRLRANWSTRIHCMKSRSNSNWASICAWVKAN